MYGTANLGGPAGVGMVWELTSAGVYKDLHDFGGMVVNGFGGSSADGGKPFGGVALDGSGDMFGTTHQGGVYNGGIVWELSSGGVYKDVHDFGGTTANADGISGPDGAGPQAGVTFDNAGNMYGTTTFGGPYDPRYGGGIVWEITGSGNYKDLHDFGKGSDGSEPFGGVTPDAHGDVYGTTSVGGLYGTSGDTGMVWEITAAGSYYDIHDFGGKTVNAGGTSGLDGFAPQSAVTLDSSGNVYGTTSLGGPYNEEYMGDGIVWESSTLGIYKDLHDFGGSVINANGKSGSDSAAPAAAITFDSAGNMYGTASGALGVNGMIWKLTTSGAYQDLHDFGLPIVDSASSIISDGNGPLASATLDNANDLCGTASAGGANNEGMIWKLSSTPVPAPPANPQATAGDAVVQLSWTESSGATSYNLYRGTTGGRTGETLYQTGLTGTAYTDTNTTNGTTYYYVLTAVSAAGQGSPSTFVSATPSTTSAIVSFVGADASTQGNWKGVYGGDGYNVIGDSSGSGPSYPNYASVTPGTYSSNLWASSTLSQAALQFSSPGSAGRVAGDWYQTSWSMDISVTGMRELALYLLDFDDAGYAETITITATASGAVLDTRSASSFAGGVYYVWNINGNVTITFTSTSAAVLSGIFFGPGSGANAPAPPTALSCTPSTNQIVLNWMASPGATEYYIYRGTTPSGESATAIASGVTGSTYTDTMNSGLTAGTTYYYKVVANNAVGGSFTSNEASAMLTKTTSSTVVSAGPNPATEFEPIQLGVTVNGLTPTGTVQLTLDGANFGTPLTLAAGSVSTIIQGLSIGDHSLSAVYSGNVQNTGSTASPLTLIILNTTSTKVSSSPNPSNVGQTVALTATVTGASPTGTVQFAVDGANVGSPASLSNDTATYKISSLSIGTHTIKATYSGDTNNAGSTSTTVTQTVNNGVPPSAPTGLTATYSPL